jgi:hypothetical protein
MENSIISIMCTTSVRDILSNELNSLEVSLKAMCH